MGVSRPMPNVALTTLVSTASLLAVVVMTAPPRRQTAVDVGPELRQMLGIEEIYFLCVVAQQIEGLVWVRSSHAVDECGGIGLRVVRLDLAPEGISLTEPAWLEHRECGGVAAGGTLYCSHDRAPGRLGMSRRAHKDQAAARTAAGISGRPATFAGSPERPLTSSQGRRRPPRTSSPISLRWNPLLAGGYLSTRHGSSVLARPTGRRGATAR